MSTRRTRNPKFVAIDHKGASGKIREILGLMFFILIYFSPDSPNEVISARIFTHYVSCYAKSRKEVPFSGLQPSKLGVSMLCRGSQLRVNED